MKSLLSTITAATLLTLAATSSVKADYTSCDITQQLPYNGGTVATRVRLIYDGYQPHVVIQAPSINREMTIRFTNNPSDPVEWTEDGYTGELRRLTFWDYVLHNVDEAPVGAGAEAFNNMNGITVGATNFATRNWRIYTLTATPPGTLGWGTGATSGYLIQFWDGSRWRYAAVTEANFAGFRARYESVRGALTALNNVLGTTAFTSSAVAINDAAQGSSAPWYDSNVGVGAFVLAAASCTVGLNNWNLALQNAREYHDQQLRQAYNPDNPNPGTYLTDDDIRNMDHEALAQYLVRQQFSDAIPEWQRRNLGTPNFNWLGTIGGCSLCPPDDSDA